MDPLNVEFSQRFGGCFSESIASVFSMLTGKECASRVQACQSLDATGVGALHSGPAVFLKAQCTKTVAGILVLALPLQEATMLVDLMLGGEGLAAAALDDDIRDALAEAFNQILASGMVAYSELTDKPVGCSGVEIMAMEKGTAADVEERFGPDPFLDLPLEMTQGNVTTVVHFLLPEPLAQSMGGLLEGGETEVPEPPSSPEPEPAPVIPPDSPAFTAPEPRPLAESNATNLDLLLDIELSVMVRMGETELLLGELLKLVPGSILEMNRTAETPVELLVNNKRIAVGEVVVVDGNFAFRITEIESPAQRLNGLA